MAIVSSISSLISLGISSHAWDDMPKLINDEMLETIAIVGSINSAKDQIHERYSKIAERVAPTFFNPNAEAPFNFINVFNEGL